MGDRSRKRLRRQSQNDTVSTESVSETTVNNPSPPFLPEELIVQILLQLPVRSLLQFKCVCKFWKTLISDPQFAKNHHVLNSTAYPQLVSFFVGIVNWHHVSYPLKPLLENPSTPVEPSIFTTRIATPVIGSCNGLLCLYHDSPRSYYFKLCNPSINLKSKKSPTIYCFDSKRMLYCGFGYDQVNDRYKVLAVVQNKFNLDETKTIVYTFGEKSWTTVQNFPCDPWRSDTHDKWWFGKFVSGTLNWIVNENVIVSFDLEKETYGEILLPQQDGGNPVLYVSGNHICVSFVHSMETHWVVWMMKEYGVVESWTKLMIVPQNKLTSEDALFISEYGVLLLRSKNLKLMVYNLNGDGGLDYRTTIFGNFAHCLHIYHESLVSPQWLKHTQKKN